MTTAPALDTRPHADVIKAALQAQLGPWDAYDYGTVPDPLPTMYALVTVERRHLPPKRSTGQAGRSGWRVTVRCVGTNDVDETRWVLDRVYQALDESRLAIDGRLTSPLLHESTTTVDPDNGRYSCLTAFTYAC